LFGGFILIFITGGFWLYARKTERLAYEQIVTSCRLLMIQIVDRVLATVCRGEPQNPAELAHPDDPKTATGPDEIRIGWERHWKSGQDYRYFIFRPNAKKAENKPDAESIGRLEEFKSNRSLQEDNHLLLDSGKNYYYGAVRASKTCVSCHRKFDPELA